MQRMFCMQHSACMLIECAQVAHLWRGSHYGLFRDISGHLNVHRSALHQASYNHALHLVNRVERSKARARDRRRAADGEKLIVAVAERVVQHAALVEQARRRAAHNMEDHNVVRLGAHHGIVGAELANPIGVGEAADTLDARVAVCHVPSVQLWHTCRRAQNGMRHSMGAAATSSSVTHACAAPRWRSPPTSCACCPQQHC